MSNAALNWAFATPIPKATDKLLLVCLANYADESGLCFPSQAKIVGDTSLDRKTVIAGLRRLIDRGLVVDTGIRKGATKQIVIYRLTIDGPMATPETVPETAPLENGPENGTVPYFPANSPVFPVKGSRISRERVPKTGHGTTKEPSEGTTREPVLVAADTDDADPLGDVDADLFADPDLPTVGRVNGCGGGRANPPRRRRPAGESPEFLAFVAAYPRKKEGPGACRAAWQKALAKASPGEIMAGLARYAFSDDPKFIPMAATWLNQERWRGQPDTMPAVTAERRDTVGSRVTRGMAIIAGLPYPRDGPPDGAATTIDADPGDWTHER
ncbi:MAG: helix-turn-helix domain-containing protein [Acetobacteraceae bacterium]